MQRPFTFVSFQRRSAGSVLVEDSWTQSRRSLVRSWLTSTFAAPSQRAASIRGLAARSDRPEWGHRRGLYKMRTSTTAIPNRWYENLLCDLRVAGDQMTSRPGAQPGHDRGSPSRDRSEMES